MKNDSIMTKVKCEVTKMIITDNRPTFVIYPMVFVANISADKQTIITCYHLVPTFYERNLNCHMEFTCDF